MSVTPEHWVGRLLRRDGNLCVWCSTPLSTRHPDLVVTPLVGRHSRKLSSCGSANLVVACKQCDGRRRGRSAAAFLTRCEREGRTARRDVLVAALEGLLKNCPRGFRPQVRDQLVELGALDTPITSNRGLWRLRRMREIMLRDEPGCVWCSRPLDPCDATFEHVLPQCERAGWRLTNLMAACGECNHTRRSTPAAEWALACERDGQRVRMEALMTVLDGLAGDADPKVARYARDQMALLSQPITEVALLPVPAADPPLMAVAA